MSKTGAKILLKRFRQIGTSAGSLGRSCWRRRDSLPVEDLAEVRTALGLFAIECQKMHGVLHVAMDTDRPWLNSTVMKHVT